MGQLNLKAYKRKTYQTLIKQLSTSELVSFYKIAIDSK